MGQVRCLLVQRLGRCTGLFHQGGILLGVSIELTDGVNNLVNLQSLGTCCLGNFFQKHIDLLGIGNSFGDVYACALDHGCSLRNPLHAFGDECTDLARRCRTATCQRAYF